MAAAAERKSWMEPNTIIGERERERERESQGVSSQNPTKAINRSWNSKREREEREEGWIQRSRCNAKPTTNIYQYIESADTAKKVGLKFSLDTFTLLFLWVPTSSFSVSLFSQFYLFIIIIIFEYHIVWFYISVACVYKF